MSQTFTVGDVIRTQGGRTPWRIESIGPGTLWHSSNRGDFYRCVSLTSGRHEEHRVGSSWLEPWTEALPETAPKPSTLKGHTLRDEGAPHNDRGVRIGSSWRGRGEGRAKCSCGQLSEVLQSAGARKRWHREHKDLLRAEQAA